MNPAYVNLLAKQGKSITRGMNKKAKTDHTKMIKQAQKSTIKG